MVPRTAKIVMAKVKYTFELTIHVININVPFFKIFILQARENRESQRNRRGRGKHRRMKINLKKAKLDLVQTLKMTKSIQIKIKKLETLIEPVSFFLFFKFDV